MFLKGARAVCWGAWEVTDSHKGALSQPWHGLNRNQSHWQDGGEREVMLGGPARKGRFAVFAAVSN